MLEEYRRRARAGKRVPNVIEVRLHLDPETGAVVEVELPQRYGG
jgi:hypothetical protein